MMIGGCRAIAILLFLGSWPAAADVAELGEGAWRQVLQRQSYRFAPTWSAELCPPRPPDKGSTAARPVQLTGSTERYLFRSGRDTFGSHDCLSSNPALEFRGYDPASGTTRCQTPDSSATREEEEHRLIRRGEHALEITARFHYHWILKGAVCEAWMDEVRRFERTPPAPPPAPEPPPPPPEVAAPTPPPALTPPAAPTTPAAPPSAPPATRPRESSPSQLTVVLPEQRGGPREIKGGAAVSHRRTGSLEAHGVTASRTLVLVGALVGLLLLGLLASLWLARRARQRAGLDTLLPLEAEHEPAELIMVELPAQADEDPPPPSPAAPAATSPPPGSPAPVTVPADEGPACPRCGRRLPAGARFCPFDGASVPTPATDPPSRPALPTFVRICPECQAEYPPEQESCPRDGALLLTVFPLREPSAPSALPAVCKVCPTCDRRYPADISFCGADGTPLVMRR
ncbi:MAG: zinc ribbon domain-containing protein [Myxococcota bacterium]|jgi:hypothetical protein|nr:zinc ribbon domain-containing protein [Myxococcota bacterium]